ncbi:MAG: Calx-beta domain-containing protein, partial [Cyanobacteriota bacterium]|nr:Calx-beta domain-containing protein [Cyanobacteriota bacterium]
MPEIPGSETNGILPTDLNSNDAASAYLGEAGQFNTNSEQTGGANVPLDDNYPADLEEAFSSENAEDGQILFAEAPAAIEVRSTSQVDPLTGVEEGEPLVGEITDVETDTPLLFSEGGEEITNNEQNSAIARQREVELNFDLLKNNAPQTVSLNLFKNAELKAKFEEVKSSNDGEKWVTTGQIVGEANSEITIISSKDGDKVLGEIKIDYEDENKEDAYYEISSEEDGTEVVSELKIPPFGHCLVCGGSHETVNHGSDDGPAFAEAPAALSGNSKIDGLLYQTRWDPENNDGTITYSFITAGTASSYYGRETVSEPSDAVKRNVREIFEMLEQYVDVDFQEVTDTANSYGEMRIMFSQEPSRAYTYLPPEDYIHEVSGDVHLLPAFEDDPNNAFASGPGSYGYMTLIHEIGHGLGLKHPGNYSDGERGPFLTPGQDNNTNTLMTYSGLGGSNKSSSTPMAFDIQALQYLYGSNTDFNSGNTTYTFDSVYGFSDGSKSVGSASEGMKVAIWDGGGSDTLNFSKLPALGLEGFSYDYRIDLSEGGFITTADVYNSHEYIAVNDSSGNTYKTSTEGTAIAYDAVIENVINSPGNDLIYANSAANTFRGYAPGKSVGADQIVGSDSKDTLRLAGYSPSSVTQSREGQDLVIDLGGDGEVRVSGYYRNSDRINIEFGGDKPLISIEDVTVTEGENNNARFKISLSETSNKTVKVEYATASDSAEAGQDYRSRSGTVTFTAGQKTKTVNVPVIDNQELEFEEQFVLNLTNPTNAITSDRQGVATILDNDTENRPAIAIDDVTITEGNTGTKNAQFTVRLSKASDERVTVAYETAESTIDTATSGSDFRARQGTLNFQAGQTIKRINVPVVGDRAYEADEQFFVLLSDATNATIADDVGLGLIENNDKNVSVSIDDVTIKEGNAGQKQAQFVVSLDEASGQTIKVDYRTADSTAIAGSDYRAKTGTLTFQPGQKTKRIRVPVLGDRQIENDEFFWVNINNPSNVEIERQWGLATIQNNDTVPSISVKNATVTEGNGGTKDARFVLTLDKTSKQSITVDYSTANETAEAGSDYDRSTGRITFQPGQKRKVIKVPVIGEREREEDETFRLYISNPNNATIENSSAKGTIKNNDFSSIVSISDITVAERDSGSPKAQFTLSLDEANDKVVRVKYATANDTAKAGQDYVAKSGWVTFQPGQTSKKITVRLKGDEKFEEDETFFLKLTDFRRAIAESNRAVGTIENDDEGIIPLVSVSDVTITEGNANNKNARFKVSLSEASNQTVKVDYQTVDSTAEVGSDYRKRTGTLTFQPGQTAKNLNVVVLGDSVAE